MNSSYYLLVLTSNISNFMFFSSSFRNLFGKITIQEPTFDRIIVVYRYYS